MIAGPGRTDVSKFKGLSFGLGKAAAAAPGPHVKGKFAPGVNVLSGSSAPKRRPAPQVAGLFAEAMQEDEGGGSAVPSWSKQTHESLQAHRQAEALLAENPTVFQYDEIIDDIKEDCGLAKAGGIRTDALEQKKRVGLTIPEGAESVKNGSKRPAKYIEKVIIATDRRRVEQQVVEDRLLKKEKDARKDCEVFVTEAFKEELKKRKKFEDELEQQDIRDKIRAADKQENGLGFADMYRNLLNGGLASSRGGEKIKDIAPAREEMKEELKEELKDDLEVDTKVKLEDAKQEVKDEDMGGAEKQHGVQDVVPEPSPASSITKAKEAEQREEKAMSAKERYLMRKKMESAAIPGEP